MNTLFDLDFEVAFKNLFEENAFFRNVSKGVNYPVDIYETDSKLFIELACIGLDSKDINIEVQEDILKVSYIKKQNEQDDRKYISRSIARRSFNFEYKISSKYDLSKLDVSLEKGLLKMEIPLRKESLPKKIEIKTK